MIVAEIEKRSRSEIGVRFPAVVHSGEQVCNMQGVPIGVVRSVDGDLVKISITDPLAAKLVGEGALNAVALLDGRLTVIDNPMLVKSGGTIWKVAGKMATRPELLKAVNDQLREIGETLERLSAKAHGPQAPDRSSGGGPLRATRHEPPESIARALGVADDQAAQERLAHLLIQASGAARPLASRPVSPGLRATVSKMSQAEQDAAVVRMIGAALDQGRRPETVMRAPRRSPEQLAKVADVVRPLSREERESVAVELIRQTLSRRR